MFVKKSSISVCGCIYSSGDKAGIFERNSIVRSPKLRIVSMINTTEYLLTQG